MKILFASSSSGSRGGGEGFLVYLGGALAARGHEVTLWTSRHERMDEVAERFAAFGGVRRADYTNTYDRRGRSIEALLDGATARRAAAEWRALAPDVIHINKQNLEDGLDLLRAARALRSPSLCTIHITQSAAYLGARGAWLRDAVARRGLAAYRGPVVAVSEARREDLARFLGQRMETMAIPNGVPIPPEPNPAQRELLRASLSARDEDLVVFAVGRMAEQKRPLVFLDVAARILQRIPQARFFWIGDGPLAAQWNARVQALDLGGRVTRLGWREDVAALLGCGDLLLHTAAYEGLPLAVLEAMAAGLPCALFESLALELPFLDRSISVVISDSVDWIDTLADRARLRHMARSAHARAVADFSVGTMAARYEALYRQLQNPSGSR